MSDFIIESTTITGRKNYLKSYIGCDKRVVIPDGVEYIGFGAFSSSYIEEIIMPDSIINIEDCAFCGCKKLKKIRFSNKILHMGERCFSNCISLEEISLPECLKYMGDHMFEKCSKLIKIAFPKNVSRIPDYVCADCTSLQEVKIPKEAYYIGAYAFYGCRLLHKFDATKSSVCIIGRDAFYECDNLCGVKGNYRCVSKKAFGNCQKLYLPGEKSEIISINQLKNFGWRFETNPFKIFNHAEGLIGSDLRIFKIEPTGKVEDLNYTLVCSSFITIKEYDDYELRNLLVSE